MLCHGNFFNVADENCYERAVLTDITYSRSYTRLYDCTATLKQLIGYVYPQSSSYNRRIRVL